MLRRPRAISIVSGVLLLFLASGSHAQVYRPFTPVQSVCPACTTGPKYDRITLVDGTEILARVIAENPRFYVLEKFGEFRAVGRDQVRTLERNAEVERPTGYGDQILFKDGIVLAGTIQGTKNDGDGFEIWIPMTRSSHVAPRERIDSVHRSGTLVFGAGR